MGLNIVLGKMDLEEFDELSGWLSLTQQELEILKILYRLEVEGTESTPNNIAKVFRRTSGKTMLKPNLFHLLKKLKQLGYVRKTGYGVYTVDFEGINRALDRAEEGFKSKQEEFKRFRGDLEGSFKKLSWGIIAPKVEYLEYDDFYRKMGGMSLEAQTICMVASFPQLAYSREVIQGLGRAEYLEPFYKQAVTKGKLHVEYLTDLNVDYLFNHCFRVMEDPKKAYRECHATLNKLENLCEKHVNIDVRYLEDPHGLDVAVRLRENEPREFILFIRDEHGDIMAGIDVKSRETSANAHQMFRRGYEYATPITSPAGRKILEKIRENLTEKYGILEQ